MSLLDKYKHLAVLHEGMTNEHDIDMILPVMDDLWYRHLMPDELEEVSQFVRELVRRNG